MQPIQKRMVFLFCLLGLFASMLVFRLGYIMLNPYYMETGKGQSSLSLSQQVKRGTIYDTDFAPLTNRHSSPMAAILLTQENATEVAGITTLTPKQRTERLQSGKPFLAPVATLGTHDENISPFLYYQRYDTPQIAPHIVGYLSDGVGATGIEKAYQPFLSESSQTVQVTYQVDANGRPLKSEVPQMKISGSGDGLVLTLDQQIQQLCQQAERSLTRGAVVVMEIETGKLRGVASFPSYDLDDLGAAIEDENSPMLNRAFLPLSVGSVFKVAIAAAALEQNISPNTTYTCTGSYTLSETVMRCSKRDGHGALNMEGALHNSCNPYFIHLGLKLDQEKLVSMLRALSFGKPTELAPGFSSAGGRLPDKTMTMGELANLSFGQGSLLATPVQVAQMMSAVARGGETPAPSLVEGTVTADLDWIEQYDTPAGLAALSEKTTMLLQRYLTAGNVVEDSLAAPFFSTAGGKTSTAQTGTFDQNGDEILFGWYAGFAPAEHPKYAIVVVAEQAESGNKTAAPVFARMVDQLFLLGKLGLPGELGQSASGDLNESKAVSEPAGTASIHSTSESGSASTAPSSEPSTTSGNSSSRGFSDPSSDRSRNTVPLVRETIP